MLSPVGRHPIQNSGLRGGQHHTRWSPQNSFGHTQFADQQMLLRRSRALFSRLTVVESSNVLTAVRTVRHFVSRSPALLDPRLGRLHAPTSTHPDFDASYGADAAPSVPAGPVTRVPIDDFDLEPDVIAALKASGFDSLFEVQAATLPDVLGGKDVIVRARTGTGKTLGFAIPVINFLVANKAADRPPRDRTPIAIIMTPTRELAVQVEEVFGKIGKKLGLQSICVYGGASITAQVQPPVFATFRSCYSGIRFPATVLLSFSCSWSLICMRILAWFPCCCLQWRFLH